MYCPLGLAPLAESVAKSPIQTIISSPAEMIGFSNTSTVNSLFNAH